MARLSDEEFTERLKIISAAMRNPCNDNEHDFEDSVNAMDKGTMLMQICRKCFTPQGWIYNWHDPNDRSY
jgi:hypothetical protein